MREIIFNSRNDQKEYVIKNYVHDTIFTQNHFQPLTYLVGAKCRDGIIIASDSRIIAEYEIETGNKILQLDENIVIGATGTTRFFKKFLYQLNDNLKDKPSKSLNEIVILAEDTIHGLSNRYGERTKGEGIECFIAIKDAWKKNSIYTNNAKLFALTTDGSALPIDGIKALGHAEPYGAMFLRMLWNRSFSMRKTAELVKFVIDIVYSLGLDVTVDHRLQYFCIPYRGEPDFMSIKDMETIDKNVQKMMEIFDKAIHDISDMRYADSMKEIDAERQIHYVDLGDIGIQRGSKKNSKKVSKKKRIIS